MQQGVASSTTLLPIGFQVAEKRQEDPNGTYDSDQQAWIDEDGSVEQMATWITDPQKQEWDD
jgi:hypothetical protein